MSGGKWLSQEQKATIRALALEGVPLVKIAPIVGCVENSIVNVLRAKGILTAAKTARRARKSKAHLTYLCTVGKDQLLQRLQAGFR